MRRLKLGRVGMKELEKIFKHRDVPLEIWSKIIHNNTAQVCQLGEQQNQFILNVSLENGMDIV